MTWQQYSGSHLVPFMMNIDGSKFEEHRFNTPRDMLDSVIYLFVERLMTSPLSSFAYYAGISGHPGGSTPGTPTGNPRAW